MNEAALAYGRAKYSQAGKQHVFTAYRRTIPHQFHLVLSFFLVGTFCRAKELPEYHLVGMVNSNSIYLKRPWQSVNQELALFPIVYGKSTNVLKTFSWFASKAVSDFKKHSEYFKQQLLLKLVWISVRHLLFNWSTGPWWSPSLWSESGSWREKGGMAAVKSILLWSTGISRGFLRWKG